MIVIAIQSLQIVASGQIQFDEGLISVSGVQFSQSLAVGKVCNGTNISLKFNPFYSMICPEVEMIDQPYCLEYAKLPI